MMDPDQPILWSYVEKTMSTHSDAWSADEWAVFVEEFDETFSDVAFRAAKDMMVNR